MRRGGLHIRPNRVRCVPGPGGCGGWAGRIYNAPLQQEWQRVQPARAARTHSPAGRCGHRPLRGKRGQVRRGGLHIRPNRVRCVPGPGGCGGWAGRIYNAPLQQEWQRVQPARAARTHSPAGRCGHRPLRRQHRAGSCHQFVIIVPGLLLHWRGKCTMIEKT